MSQTKPTIKVILGSTRPARFGVQPANWIMELTKNHPEANFELVDLEKVNLPMLDEPVPAAAHQYTKDHTKKWSEIVDSADGFVFVTAEYNHGMPAALKNAIDFVAREWSYKPVAFVSYGAEAGGARSVEQLRQVTGWLRMYDLGEFVLIPNYWTQMDKEGKFTPTAAQNTAAETLLKSITFWSTELKPIRKKLQKEAK